MSGRSHWHSSEPWAEHWAHQKVAGNRMGIKVEDSRTSQVGQADQVLEPRKGIARMRQKLFEAWLPWFPFSFLPEVFQQGSETWGSRESSVANSLRRYSQTPELPHPPKFRVACVRLLPKSGFCDLVLAALNWPQLDCSYQKSPNASNLSFPLYWTIIWLLIIYQHTHH